MEAKRRTWMKKSWTLLAGAILLWGGTGCQPPNALLRREGMDALNLNDVPQADQRFSQAVRQDDTDWKSQYYLGLVRLRQHRPLDAQLALEKALTLRPEDKYATPEILDALAESIFQQNQPANLTAMLQKAADDYGTVPDYLRQAKYLGKSGDVDGAKLAFRKALKFAPKDDPQPYIAMADFFESVGDTQGAITALRKAFYIMPRSQRLGERFRRYGIVPGPTVALEPSQDEDELVERMEPARQPMTPGK